jgi:general secretion pathway protein N
MPNVLRQNPLALALSVIAAILVVVIVAEAWLGRSLWSAATASSAKPAAPADAKMIPPLAVVVPDQAYPETAARPLFTPTRRPAPAAPSVANTMTKGQFTLMGVIAVRDQRTALLREKSGGKVHRVDRGKEINGMTLTAVENDQVTLSQGGDQEVLTLQVQKGPAVAAAAPAAPSAGPFGPMAGQPAAGPGPTPAGQPGPGVAPAQPAPQPAIANRPPTPPNPANPAQRSGFGPFPQSQQSGGTSEATPMTPEELLARRRARRGQQQPPQ